MTEVNAQQVVKLSEVSDESGHQLIKDLLKGVEVFLPPSVRSMQFTRGLMFLLDSWQKEKTMTQIWMMIQ